MMPAFHNNPQFAQQPSTTPMLTNFGYPSSLPMPNPLLLPAPVPPQQSPQLYYFAAPTASPMVFTGAPESAQFLPQFAMAGPPPLDLIGPSKDYGSSLGQSSSRFGACSPVSCPTMPILTPEEEELYLRMCEDRRERGCRAITRGQWLYNIRRTQAKQPYSERRRKKTESQRLRRLKALSMMKQVVQHEGHTPLAVENAEVDDGDNNEHADDGSNRYSDTDHVDESVEAQEHGDSDVLLARAV